MEIGNFILAFLISKADFSYIYSYNKLNLYEYMHKYYKIKNFWLKGTISH